MSIQSIAVASAKSFGDFVIAHSVLHRIEEPARRRLRLLACSHLRALSAILPADVGVTLVTSGEEHVPAIFDVKKRGAWSAVRSALTLRRQFQMIERHDNEVLAFDALGVRERFIAGSWPVIGPRSKGANIYETYSKMFAEHGAGIAAAPATTAGRIRSVGIFPESRLVEKILTRMTLATILERAARAGVAAKLFILDGDRFVAAEFVEVTRIQRNFESLANAIRSVDGVISADSLPAHLAEYFARPVFVASASPNEYWLPPRCFAQRSWALFGEQVRFSDALDRFLSSAASS